MKTAVLPTCSDSNEIREQIKRINETVDANYAFIEKCESSVYAKNRCDMFSNDIAAREMEMQKLMARRASLVRALDQQYA